MRELQALKHFNQPETKHQHLIILLAAYSQKGEHFLIFPCAEYTLDNFWQAAGTSPGWNSKWLLDQCHGITQGLDKVHEYDVPESPGQTGNPSDLPSDTKKLVGRHGDIKPQNILWFRNPVEPTEQDTEAMGRLVLSDFTLMRFHNQGRNTATTMGSLGGTMTYRAPEVTVMSDKHASQKYDVWSLGCVFLEFVSCHLLGYNATRGECFQGRDDRYYKSFVAWRLEEDIRYKYHEDRFFLYRPGMKKAKVKESVKQVSQESTINPDNMKQTYPSTDN